MASIGHKTLVSVAAGAIFLAAPGISSASAAVVAAPAATASSHDDSGNGTITTPGKPTAGKWEWFKCAWAHLDIGLTQKQILYFVPLNCDHHLDD